MYERGFSEKESTKIHLRKTVNRQVEAMTEEEVKELLLQTTGEGKLGEVQVLVPTRRILRRSRDDCCAQR